MRSTQPAEIMPLHRTGKTASDRGAGCIDKLSFDKMIGCDFGSNIDQIVRRNPELDHLAGGFHFGDGKLTAIGTGDIFDLCTACAKLQCRITILIVRAMGNDPALIDFQHGHGHVFTGVGKDPAHPQFLRY
jgi:hypothetical protein